MENSKTASTAESGGTAGASRRDATGLIALRPDTGQELWRQSLKALPRKHDCNLVDVNGDGLQDCLVVGDGGLLTAIEPRTGMLILYCGGNGHQSIYGRGIVRIFFTTSSKNLSIPKFLKNSLHFLRARTVVHALSLANCQHFTSSKASRPRW